MVTAGRIDAMFVRDHLPELKGKSSFNEHLTGYRSSKSISGYLPTLPLLDGVSVLFISPKSPSFEH